MSEEILPLQFEKLGWHHSQVARDGSVALYKRWKLYDGQPGAEHYEVVKIVYQQTRVTKDGVTYPAGERYPSSNSWGKFGFTYKLLAEAMAKYAELLAQQAGRAAAD